jgi:RNA polymerase sigma-70 factor (ECF subfamily)
MALGESNHDSEPAHAPVFATTHWSVVLAAAKQSDTKRGCDALARLCQIYWYPLYAYVRRRGYSAHDAEDLTQAFFAQLLERHSLAAVEPERGSFRSFMLAVMKHFLANEREKGMAQKRGGGCQILSLDWVAAERRFDLEPATYAAPDKLFEKQWALTLLAEVLNRLEHEYHSEGKGDLFAALKQTLMGLRESQPYAQLARELGVNESAVAVAVHRLRKRYRELIRAEIANTLDDAEDVDAEIRHLFQVLAN